MPLRHLVLVRMAALEQAHRAHRREDPRQLVDLRHVALAEEHRALRVQPAGEEIHRQLAVQRRSSAPLLDRGHRVVVGDEVEPLALVLQAHRRLHRPEVVAQVQLPARLESRQNAHRGAAMPEPAAVCNRSGTAVAVARWREHPSATGTWSA